MNSLLQCGSVASLRGYENPISVARLIMQDPEQHIFYAQDYAAEIAREHQIRTLEDVNLVQIYQQMIAHQIPLVLSQ